jgi:four helix bundle protein
MGTINNFKELNIWKKSIELVKEIYKITEKFPNSEIYGLTSQMRRAAVSIPSNVAEGFKRRYSKEFKQFLNIAMGSSAELETQVVIARELGYLKVEVEASITERLDHISRMSANLVKKL